MAEIEFVEKEVSMQPRIKVVGVGGAGSNAVDNMVNMGLKGVEFFVVNTDIQALQMSRCSNKLQIGTELTHGRGAGSDPVVGEKAAIAAKDTLTEMIAGADMLFIAAGFGGGTGTGAAPVMAEAARELGILTIGFITRPFVFEGPQRIKKADLGIQRMRECCDTLVVISNERLLEVVGNKATLTEAFKMANDVLAQGVQSISELITVPGLINVDFGDVCSIMSGNGGAIMGVGVGKGEHRAIEAVKKACSNPLIDRKVIEGATSILLCITGGDSLKLEEIKQATSAVYEDADPNVNITLGVVIDKKLKDEIKVTIVGTGFREESLLTARETPAPAAVSAPRTAPENRRPEPARPVTTPARQPEQSLVSGSAQQQTSPASFTLKEKLESMLAAENQIAGESRAPERTTRPAPAPRRDDSREDFAVNFNRPDNPLRNMQSDDSMQEMPMAQEEKKPEDDLDSPAFIRRRKSLFD
ncbi:MAG TPA: cell division protein FtsZ [Candidatus Sumerlaeota bacterium]|nr:cell division protein FtsZ [Candidatus Sumerlaeota bacterium]